MKLPIMQKIEIEEFGEEHITSIFKKNFLGQIPSLLIFRNLPKEKYRDIEKKCFKILLELAIDPNFPYPIYIYCEENIHFNHFPAISSLDDLPRHFIKKIKKIKVREQSLFTKALTMSSRINNHEVTDDLNYIKKMSKLNKQLKSLCVEKAFYRTIVESFEGEN